MGQETEQRGTHTPGPWTAETGLPFNCVQCGTGDQSAVWVLSYEGGEPISQDQERADADARLIAAAPDLLAAAKEAVTELYDCLEDLIEDLAEVDLLTVRKLQAAISKAEGKS